MSGAVKELGGGGGHLKLECFLQFDAATDGETKESKRLSGPVKVGLVFVSCLLLGVGFEPEALTKNFSRSVVGVSL